MSLDNSTASSTECPYTILPIEGMEFVQQNFVKYKDGDRAAQELMKAERMTLAKRFQLLERGFVLQLKENALASKLTHGRRECILDCQSPILVKNYRKKKNKKKTAKTTEEPLPVSPMNKDALVASPDKTPLASPSKTLNPGKLLAEKQNIEECVQ